MDGGHDLFTHGIRHAPIVGTGPGVVGPAGHRAPGRRAGPPAGRTAGVRFSGRVTDPWTVVHGGGVSGEDAADGRDMAGSEERRR
ncbi:hypothetical protein Shyd_73760 [Streptomyces hydrogenans]|uniref:Uncharacterized protein n=1 Tax=Streptomyces hydrogenans TaxID=1873719 RepID=A0ABQ3PLW1_9ACTN|nr:hypothetical protein GCM10018784_28910 [Streptomyces hydrogenans]GHI26005.1 hypothetical protein Shyd_73760 [Streptomyces hydrogenans]